MDKWLFDNLEIIYSVGTIKENKILGSIGYMYFKSGDLVVVFNKNIEI